MKIRNNKQILLFILLSTGLFIGISFLQNGIILNSTNKYSHIEEENNANFPNNSGYWDENDVQFIHINNDKTNPKFTK